MQQRQAILLALVALVALAGLAALGLLPVNDPDIEAPSSEEQRSLLPQDPLLPTKVTVYLVASTPYQGPFSIFRTDMLQRYGSGRVDYDVVEGAKSDKSGRDLARGNGPCLVVLPNTPIKPCRRCNQYKPKQILRNYRRCRTMAAGDEFCAWDGRDHGLPGGYDVRHYRSDRGVLGGAGYLPLGPRIDTWESLRMIRDGRATRPASARRYAFNAIFTADTNPGRAALAGALEGGLGTLAAEAFVSVAREWTSDVNDAASEQLDTDSYARVLLDSAFTLSPAGHNPECYRMHEAVSAGSIPVLLRADLEGDGNCVRPLRGWEGSPVLILDSWDELYPAMGGLMAEPRALDEMQARLGDWYDAYMRGAVKDFEDLMIGAAPAAIESE